ncbi:MAG: arginine deiminase [Saprospiraceae bacterium]|nr:arginine deiminase [Saprospiraceae bacterium]
MNNPIQVSSEIGSLKRVIVHRPDEGISRISPRRAEELLFDDIVHLPQMQEEHDVFTGILRQFLGAENVLETQNLLEEALIEDTDSKKWMLDRIIDYEELHADYAKLLTEMDNKELAQVLISGYYKAIDTYLFDPIPNFIFTRDIAVTINDHVLITKAAKEARARENFLTRFIFFAHPIFRKLKESGKLINLNHINEFPPSRLGQQVSLEGGDVMIINKDYLLIGRSERTTQHAIHSLRDVLFAKGVVNNVVQINIPADRSYMHIDTIFTQIKENHIVAFKPIIVDGLSSNVEVFRRNGEMATYSSVAQFFQSEINPEMEFILSGNGETPYQEREQWTDGCNLVAIRPGVALTYDRNPYTEQAFRDKGYEVLHARDLLEKMERGEIQADNIQNTIITLPSNELSRARGGSHCMTCPIERR